MQGLFHSVQLPRRRGEVETPMSNQPPRGAQGRRLLVPAALCPCPFASLHGQVRARLGPGGYCRCSGNGGPHTCLPAACGVTQRWPSTTHLHQHRPKTLARGQASRGGRHGASSGTASSGWLVRRRRDQGGVPHKVPVLLGNVAEIQNFPTCHQDLSMEKPATREKESASTYPCRSLSGSVQVNGVDGVVLTVIQITDDPSGERTAPPHSTHVQPGDVSHALIQQGERERLTKTPSSSSTTAWWWWRSVAILQGFAKHRGRGGRRDAWLLHQEERNSCVMS